MSAVRATGPGARRCREADEGFQRGDDAQPAGGLLAAEPVGDFRQPGGAVVLARSTTPLDTRIAVTWAWIALIGVGGLAASALVSVWLARWVGRPLTALDTAAQHLGEGELGERAAVTGGPPEVRRLAATFNTMAARTEALIHGHQAVVADVSHQLRTPLTALRLRLDLLAAAPKALHRSCWPRRRRRSRGSPDWWTACWRSRESSRRCPGR
ncbi:HAMP domain-containing protein [Kitasatospora sp. NBC_00315]|uniref:HAMP domain-containing protein n=1 Tax=Kitasatospora sp. NBC_00315 TaxID=2975963 RepID=UPI00324D098F